MKQQSFDHVRERCFLIILSICVSSLVERRISNERVDVARNLSSCSSSAGSIHPPEAKKDLFRLSCADSIRPPKAKNCLISSTGGRNTMTGPTSLRFSGGSAGKIRVRACALSRCGQNTRVRVRVSVSVSLTAIEFSCRPPEAKNYLISSVGDQERFVLARQAQVHFIRRRPRRICLACHAQIQVVRRRPRTISYRPPEAVTL